MNKNDLQNKRQPDQHTKFLGSQKMHNLGKMRRIGFNGKLFEIRHNMKIQQHASKGIINLQLSTCGKIIFHVPLKDREHYFKLHQIT